MPWQTLGTVNPNLLNWETIPASVLGNLFRVRQNWVGEWPGQGYIRLRLVQADGSFYEMGRLYATRDEQLITYPLDPVLIEAGYVARRFQLKLNMRARIFAVANWQVTIEEYLPSDDDPFQIIDGGTYDNGS
ncbi:hypothetical protein IQ265_23220 [Nodosilinea sp. LEGE 06152]|uniref:hypothetical protein n=1 Tax=Nodosilinea sp. LEGE 06152 TaxID=2777966 RepID=UPI001882A8CA|nr:hypothetical protein [Nodosilinea sp. LEGE 06152]MBE9159723.1 hypothetical protein [Nodosilinea sp. LEGE 06152]